MKEVGKIKKIYNGFFGEELPENLSKERRDICYVCPFNSANTDKLSLIDSVRKDFAPPFCTLCKCNIKEKTGSALEECAMYKIGEDKKWFKIKIETMENNELNLIQVGDNKYDISLSGESFMVNMNKLSNSSDTNFEFVLESKEGVKIEYKSIIATCGCSEVAAEQMQDNTIAVKGKINMKKVGFGPSVKLVEVSYEMDVQPRVQKLKFKFYKVA